MEPRTEALKMAPDSRPLPGPQTPPLPLALCRKPWSRRGQRSPCASCISPICTGQPGREALWRRRRVLGEAWLKNLEVISGRGRAVDLVCFTGDVAFAGGERSMFALPISCASCCGG